jgi:hypothetical protein
MRIGSKPEIRLITKKGTPARGAGRTGRTHHPLETLVQGLHLPPEAGLDPVAQQAARDEEGQSGTDAAGKGHQQQRQPKPKIAPPARVMTAAPGSDRPVTAT